MVSQQQVRLRWNTHHGTLITVLESLLSAESLVDVTLAAEGQYVRAHKVILCACSPYFQELLSIHEDKHPIIFLQDVKYTELQALLSYMYRGEVNISQESLSTLLRVAESLQIRGIFDSNSPSSTPSDEEIDSIINDSSSVKAGNVDSTPQPPPPPAATTTTTNPGRRTRSSGQSTTNQRNDNTNSNSAQAKSNAHQESNSTVRDEAMGDGGGENVCSSNPNNNSSSSHSSKRAKVDRKGHTSSSNVSSSAPTSVPQDNFSLDNSTFSLASFLPELNIQNNSQLFDLSNDDTIIKFENSSPPPTSPPPDDDDKDEEQSQDGHQGTEQVFRCVKCGKQYTSNKSLWRHRKFACDGKQTFSCQLCGKSFSRSDNLRRHAVVAHCIQ